VNLAGASIGRVPWTASYRQVVVRSRVDTTRTLAQAVAAVPRPPVFLAQSAIGYYGKGRADTPLDEEAGPGSGFFADLVCAWEEAATPAEAAGARVVRMRSGVVLDRSGGPFPLLALPFRFGLGGRLGSGQQVMGMISLDDWLAAVLFLVEHPDCQGPYNLTMPDPPTNAEFTKALAAALHRPAPLVVPAVAIRTVLRGLADELLGSARVVPRRLLDAGFEFSAPDVTTLVAAALHRR
jgi:uncharacterized protein (TIGR01777 family)